MNVSNLSQVSFSILYELFPAALALLDVFRPLLYFDYFQENHILHWQNGDNLKKVWRYFCVYFTPTAVDLL